MRITRIPGFNPGPMTGAGNNTYLLPGRTPTLLDAATGEAAHLSAVARALGSDRLAQVLVTHAHQDHADGSEPIAERWPDAAFRKMPWPERDRAHAVAWKPIADDELVPRRRRRAARRPHAGSRPRPSLLLRRDRRHAVLGRSRRPGHHRRHPRLARTAAASRSNLASLRRVQALAPARMLPAHGEPIDDPQAILREYIEHRRRREAQIVAALRAGVGRPDDIVDRLYDGLAPALRGMARESVVAHLIKLAEEGRARSEGPEWEVA